ncbi:MAG TPA: hypothetical protein VFX43_13545 [Chitinophagaceae bacterium]|nr:hypothetical protein [Chitinophagaceae bacterium]
MTGKKGKHIVRRIFIALASLAMITGFVVLFIAASRDRSEATCKAMVIRVAEGGPLFVNKAGIAASITGNKKLNPVGKKLEEINMALLEKSVKTFPWVKDAELYVDNDNKLRVNITQRVPMARIFTRSGNSFYIDKRGTRLPVTGSFAIRMPVFTDFPSDAVTMNGKDSLLFSQVIALSRFITRDSFWMAQISQINVTRGSTFELIPTLGNALIEFGEGTDIPAKFNKLMAFYLEGLNNVGWGYYDTLDVQYKGQVVATRRKGAESPLVDSLLTRDAYHVVAEQSQTALEQKILSGKPPTENKKAPKAIYRGIEP